MADAAALLPRSEVYGLASCRVGTQFMEFEIGWPEFERDTAWAQGQLERAGLRRGDMVLTTMTNWELPWTGPVVHALRNLGVTYLTAEVFAWDVKRVVMFLQRFPVRAMIGLSGQTLHAMVESGAPVDELLNGPEFIWARPNAIRSLDAHRAQVLPFVRFGPALAMGVPGRTDALLDAAEWRVTDTAHGLAISNVAERAAQFRNIDTGFSGTARRDGSEVAVSITVTGPSTA